VLTSSVAYGVFRGGLVGVASESTHYVVKPRVLVSATGAQERSLDFPNNDLPGVIGAGGAQTIMNEFGVKPGETVLDPMAGSGTTCIEAVLLGRNCIAVDINYNVVILTPHRVDYFARALRESFQC
jgi:tRNA G10  N-methylase Trm11